MAEFLIRTTPHPDPKIDRGDIVDVQEDGFTWGVRESKQNWLASGKEAVDWPGTFAILKIVGMAAAEARALGVMGPQLSDQPVEGDFVTVKVREWFCDIEAVPEVLRGTIRENGGATVLLEDVHIYVKNKSTGQTL